MKPKFIVHTTTVTHSEYVVTANTAEEITGWVSLLPSLKEEVICHKITHLKSINDYEYHNEYNSGMKPSWMNDPVEGSRYEVPRGEEDE